MRGNAERFVCAMATGVKRCTVLIATCNRLDLLRPVIDSIARGTRTPIEIIVIDGGSTDGTVEYLRTDPRVTPVLQGELLGTARRLQPCVASRRDTVLVLAER